MPLIHLTTFIEAPQSRVFDLSRNVSLHTKSMLHTKEQAIEGKTQGLINLNESVTWKANHLFKTRILQTTITAMQPYSSFTDEMVKGDFKMMRHQHHFKAVDNGTIMIDLFEFQSPYSFIGKLVNLLFLTNYMKKQLEVRNAVIKDYAETDKWKQVL